MRFSDPESRKGLKFEMLSTLFCNSRPENRNGNRGTDMALRKTNGPSRLAARSQVEHII